MRPICNRSAGTPEVGENALLGIDFGTRRVGLATGHRLTGCATPLRTIHHAGNPIDEIETALAEWQPALVVVGLPLQADGSESAMSRQVRHFVAQLRQRHPALAIELHDERLSSHAAAAHFTEQRRAGRARRGQARDLDSLAAALILESWLAEHG